MHDIEIHPGKRANKAGTKQAETRVEKAKRRAEQAETRTEQAKTRADAAEIRAGKAETRTEFAKTRTENAETRTEQAETRAEQAETTLEKTVGRTIFPGRETSPMAHHAFAQTGSASQNRSLDLLTIRQREVLQLIAHGQNAKQIAGILKISPKTVEYHRLKLMHALNLHDVPGLVRFALKVGLVSPES